MSRRLKSRPRTILRRSKSHLSKTLSALDRLERFLVLVFLRRYVTYCARRRRYAAMNGAARYAKLVSASPP